MRDLPSFRFLSRHRIVGIIRGFSEYAGIAKRMPYLVSLLCLSLLY
jgi:hypothetical protein